MSQIIGREYKNGSYVVSQLDDVNDAIIIKERVHFADGSTRPNLRVIENYERKFYVVKERERTYKQKKVWIEKDKCREYTSTQRGLKGAVAKVLRMSDRFGMKVMNRSEILFGTDLTPTVEIKHGYKTRWPDAVSDWETAHLDIERDVTYGTEQIQMISISSGNKIYQVVTKDYLGTIVDPVGLINGTYQKEIPELLYKTARKKIEGGWKKKGKEYTEEEIDTETKKQMRNFKVEVEVVDAEWKCVTKIFERLHKWQPDILSIWNLPYDLGKMTIALQRANIDPADVYCDPRIPRKYRIFRFTEGKAKIEDANGKAESKDPCDRWHRVDAPSSFFWADQMSVRRAVRKHKPKEHSYALGNVLERVIGHGKLSKDVGLSGIDWHKHMQKFEKIYYCVYNMWDNIGAQLHDEQELDLRSTFPLQCGYSDLQSYGSQGRKLADDLYFFLLEKGFILGGVSDKMESELDKFSITLDGWISTLSPHLINEQMGHRILEELDTFTKVVKFVLDIDVKSSYPSTGVWMNLSTETIVRVPYRIWGKDFEDQRRAGINLPSGKVNSINIMSTICNCPRPVEIMSSYERHLRETGKLAA